MRQRGQLVLIAAVLIAVAIVPLVLAYMQLGYHADVRARGAPDDPSARAHAVLVRSVHDASVDIPGSFRWSSRDVAVNRVKTRLNASISTIETALVDEGMYRTVSFNQRRARRVANSTDCPGTAGATRARGRDFGPCKAIDGIVVQNRDGWTHVVAVAFDLRTTTERERTELGMVVRPVGDE